MNKEKDYIFSKEFKKSMSKTFKAISIINNGEYRNVSEVPPNIGSYQHQCNRHIAGYLFKENDTDLKDEVFDRGSYFDLANISPISVCIQAFFIMLAMTYPYEAGISMSIVMGVLFVVISGLYVFYSKQSKLIMNRIDTYSKQSTKEDYYKDKDLFTRLTSTMYTYVNSLKSNKNVSYTEDVIVLVFLYAVAPSYITFWLVYFSLNIAGNTVMKNMWDVCRDTITYWYTMTKDW